MQKDPVHAPSGLDGVLFDLLMGVMNSLEVWSLAADDHERGLAWRDAVTARMIESDAYVPYEGLVAGAAAEVGLGPTADADLVGAWARMEPWPDADVLSDLSLPYAFVTNCSTELARIATRQSRLAPRFTLSAEEAGWFKPDARVYREASRRLGSPVERTLFVAGSPYDAEGARGAGFPTALVLRRSDQRPPSSSVTVASSLDDVLEVIDRT